MVCDELVMGRFRVVERIGTGGMGSVYRAYDERLQRQVAIKEVDAEPARVLREAQAAARLNHPGIVTLYELGERHGRAVLVSELVHGETLAGLHAEAMLSDRDVAEIGADLCEALEHAHGRGVVHRDVKPQNVVVATAATGTRRAKLLDFGIARVAGASTLTAAGEVVGTLAYMSPEQAEGEVAGPPSDTYSLALTLYECWTGTNPVAGATPAETARRIGALQPPLRAHRPDLPEGLADTIDACLDPDPAMRPTPAELSECLDAEVAGLDPIRPVPSPGSETGERRGGGSLGVARVAALASIAAGLVVLAGPVGAAGLALVLAVLLVPAALCGAPPAALALPFAPLGVAAGLGAGTSALGSAGPTLASRALLGAGAWLWLAAGSIALGVGPDLGLADRPLDGWVTDTSLAAANVLSPLAAPTSLAALAIFAVAAALLGRLLELRHLSFALAGAMLWAASLDGALSVVGVGDLAASPAGPALAALAAVAVEFGMLRPRAGAGREWSRGARALELQPLGSAANPSSGL